MVDEEEKDNTRLFQFNLYKRYSNSVFEVILELFYD